MIYYTWLADISVEAIMPPSLVMISSISSTNLFGVRGWKTRVKDKNLQTPCRAKLADLLSDSGALHVGKYSQAPAWTELESWEPLTAADCPEQVRTHFFVQWPQRLKSVADSGGEEAWKWPCCLWRRPPVRSYWAWSTSMKGAGQEQEEWTGPWEADQNSRRGQRTSQHSRNPKKGKILMIWWR
jgi:hypothetical protein